jgi:hypothetical protein
LKLVSLKPPVSGSTAHWVLSVAVTTFMVPRDVETLVIPCPDWFTVTKATVSRFTGVGDSVAKDPAVVVETNLFPTQVVEVEVSWTDMDSVCVLTQVASSSTLAQVRL